MSANETKTRSPLNSVKIRVRENAVQMRDFTVDEMVEATGCKRTSVQNEIGRMVKDGYLTTGRSAALHARPGKPTSVYHLVNDEARLQSLIKEVRTFGRAREPQPRPKSRNYELARNFIDRAQTSRSEAEKKALLNQAENLLQVAWADEGETGTVKDAFLQYEHGRLASLNKDYERADVLLKRAKDSFAKYQTFPVEAANAVQQLYANSIARIMNNPYKGINFTLRGKVPVAPYANPAVRVQRLATAMRDEELDSVSAPLHHSFVRTLNELAESMSPRRQVIGTAWDCLAAESSSEMPLKHESWGRHIYQKSCRVVIFGPQPGGQPRAIRGGRTRFRRSLYKQQIELAVRGPIHSARQMAVTMMSKIRGDADHFGAVQGKIMKVRD